MHTHILSVKRDELANSIIIIHEAWVYMHQCYHHFTQIPCSGLVATATKACIICATSAGSA